MRTERYRKKPVVIEAVQFTGKNAQALAEWMDRGVGTSRSPLGVELNIPTLEGVMIASVGDWIIRGVKGELYPCKPDIFEATYEPAPSPGSEGSET